MNRIETLLKGRVWKFGDNVDTDQIYPGKYLPLTDKKEMAQHAMEGVPDAEKFIENVKLGDMIVAGKNFGCGSSREHAVIAIKGTGVRCIIAKSFASIFYRNAINLGLPIIESPDVELIKEDDSIVVDPTKGEIVNPDKNESYKGLPLSGLELEIIKAGGLLSYLKDAKFRNPNVKSPQKNSKKYHRDIER